MLRDPFNILSPRVKVSDPTKHVLAIQTAPRPIENTLHSTLSSLQGAGVDDWTGPKIIASDSYRPEVNGWSISSSKERLGSAKTFFRLLRETLLAWPKTEYITFCEDDVVLSKNALKYIVATEIPRELSMIAWFTPYDLISEKPELKCFYNKDFYYSQMVTFTRSLANQMLGKEKSWIKVNGPDILMSRCGFRCAVHCPNLADHVGGTNSACGYSWWGPRQSVSFIGTDTDAMSLWKQS